MERSCLKPVDEGGAIVFDIVWNKDGKKGCTKEEAREMVKKVEDSKTKTGLVVYDFTDPTKMSTAAMCLRGDIPVRLEPAEPDLTFVTAMKQIGTETAEGPPEYPPEYGPSGE